jgi:hypothetical protein
MKFYGEPNLNVIDHKTHRLVCKFNDKGEFITEDERLIQKLRQHFKYEETTLKRG